MIDSPNEQPRTGKSDSPSPQTSTQGTNQQEASRSNSTPVEQIEQDNKQRQSSTTSGSKSNRADGFTAEHGEQTTGETPAARTSSDIHLGEKENNTPKQATNSGNS